MSVAGRHPFRFGTKGTFVDSAKAWQDEARRAEDLGYASFHVDDHFGTQLALVPALVAAADATSRILVGPHVAAVDFRNPVLFAKECATIDLLSEGRLILGVGAGWRREDYAVAGLAQADAATRIQRLEEEITIMRGLWAESPFAFDGEHFRVAKVDGQPKPASPIPILVGGGGPKILSMAARVADIVGINPKIVARSINARSMSSTAADVLDEKVQLVREAAGTRFEQLELQIQVFRTVVTDRPMEVAAELAPRFGVPPEQLLSAPFFQIGPVAQIIDDLQAARERWGASYFVLQGDATEAMAPVVAALNGT